MKRAIETVKGVGSLKILHSGHVCYMISKLRWRVYLLGYSWNSIRVNVRQHGCVVWILRLSNNVSRQCFFSHWILCTRNLYITVHRACIECTFILGEVSNVNVGASVIDIKSRILFIHGLDVTPRLFLKRWTKITMWNIGRPSFLTS